MQTISENILSGNILSEITFKIEDIASRKAQVLVAIDGRCASGKTTVAGALADLLNADPAQKHSCDAAFPLRCNLIHMDDFFLRPQQRTPERFAEPGGNVDYERFLEEVLLPLSRQEPFSYRPFDCKTFGFKESVSVKPLPITLIEGSYTCHPLRRDYYDLKVFLTVNEEEQLKRILFRNGKEALGAFRSKWIPLEEKYFSACNVEACCDIVLHQEETL